MRFLLFLFTSVLLLSCSKDQETSIPSVPVNIRINLDDPSNLNLNIIGNSSSIPGGIRGIIVYRLSQDKFNAFERMCSYQSADTCAYVSIDSAISSVGCKCCGSRFQLIDGSPISAPASASLRAYNTSLVGRDLYIYN